MSQAKLAMSYQEALASPWTYSDHKGKPIGSLLDNGAKSLKDLAYAYQNSYDRRLREACKVILLHHLNQETPSEKEIPRTITLIPSELRSFAEWRQIQLAILTGVVMGIFFGVYMLFMLQSLLTPRETTLSSEERFAVLLSFQGIIALLLGLLIFFVIPYFSMTHIADWLFDLMKLYRKGQEGEERVLNALYANLDGSWTVFKNLELKGYKNDFDFVLVGDTGIWVLEVKSYSGHFKNLGREWQRRFGSMWLPALGNPEKQVRNAARTINNTLKNHGIEGQWINPIIIWANPDSKLELENPNTPVYLLDELNKLKDLSGSRGISPEQKQQIIETLSNAAVKKEKQEKASS